MTENDPTAVTLNDLLRSEIAAAEAYDVALSRLEDDPASEALRAIQQEHGDAIRILRERLGEREAEAASTSGLRGSLARAVEGVAGMISAKTALRALREGEQQGAKGYESALAAGELSADERRVIQDTLLPRRHGHVQTLDRLIVEHA